jgi:ATP-dependent Zn protease
MDLLEKYKIKEEDLYMLGAIEKKKSSASYFEKEKLKAKSMGILKPYNVKFMDLGGLLNEIKSKDFGNNQVFIDKYGDVNLDTIKSSSGLKYIIPIIIGIGVFFFIFSAKNDGSESVNNVKGTESSYPKTYEVKRVCKVCYKSYTGSGYQAFGEEFCSMKCYVDK